MIRIALALAERWFGEAGAGEACVFVFEFGGWEGGDEGF